MKNFIITISWLNEHNVPTGTQMVEVKANTQKEALLMVEDHLFEPISDVGTLISTWGRA